MALGPPASQATMVAFVAPRGEFTVVLEGDARGASRTQERIDIDAELRRLRSRGVRPSDAVRDVAQRSGLPRREVYAR